MKKPSIYTSFTGVVMFNEPTEYVMRYINMQEKKIKELEKKLGETNVL